MFKFFLLFFVWFGVQAGNINSVDVKIPYIYNKGSKEIKLFISFNCFFCRQSLVDLVEYLKKNPGVKARVYYYARTTKELEKIAIMLAAENDLELIIKLYRNFLVSNESGLRELINTNKKLYQNLQKNKRKYQVYAQNMQNEIKSEKIEGTPTWILNGVYWIEGPFDKFDAVLFA